MKRYLLSLALLCLVATGAHSYWQSRAQVAISGGGGGPSYTRSAGSSGAPAGGGLTFSADIGAATATRVILIAAVTGAGTTTAVTVNGVAATNIFSSTTSSFWQLTGSAAGSGVQTVITTSGVFVDQAARVWYMDGLNSTTLKNSATSSSGGTSTTTNINITAGDFLFVLGDEFSSSADTVDFSTSTDSPANQSTILQGPFSFAAADWTTSTTNASWAIVGTHTNAAVLTIRAVSFR